MASDSAARLTLGEAARKAVNILLRQERRRIAQTRREADHDGE